MKHKIYRLSVRFVHNHPILFLGVLISLLSSVVPCSAQKRNDTKKTILKETVDTAHYINPQMVFVRGGHFVMGSNIREVTEKPEHAVTLSNFYIGKYEVTVGEFRKFMIEHTYITDAEKAGFSFVFDGKRLIYDKKGVNWECDVFGNLRIGQEDHPVIHVSQNDALAYCNWLSKKTGTTYRLPTEAEWEYAAKGGIHHDTFVYSGGNDIEKVGWYVYNSDYATHPVGKKAPNRLKIYDMTGNVWEWCADRYGLYTTEEQTNPHGPETGSQVVMRGGGWRFYNTYNHTTTRRNTEPSFNGSGPGFRLAASFIK